MAARGLPVLAVLLASPALAADAPSLSLPIACEPGKTCFIQNYVDVDAGPDARDFRCGPATYDGHKGTDFRVLSAAAASRGVPVLAAADGVVKAARDGMDDGFVTGASKGSIAGRECGNGVVLDHGAGWETQVCHLRKGSVVPRPGQRVARGDRLGDVGYSGNVEFAHVHLELRHDGETIDPFTGRGPSAGCDATTGGTGLWDAAAAKAFPYGGGEILGAGFIDDPALTERLEIDDAVPAPGRASPALVFYVRAINLHPGDRLKVIAEGPGGFQLEQTSDALDRSKASYRFYAGKRLKAPGWDAGTYRGRAALIRDGAEIAVREATLVIE